jgi:hypothetical protein
LAWCHGDYSDDAIQEQLDGKTVVWLEKVGDEQYQASSDTALIWT